MHASSARSVPAPERSVDPCPVCGAHQLALEQPPQTSVMGVQPLNELYRMGDLPMPVGVRCRSCRTWWPTIEALRAGEPGSAEVDRPVEGVDEAIAWPDRERPRDPGGTSSTVLLVGALGVGVVLAVAGVLEVAFVVVGTAVLGWAAWRRRRGGSDPSS